jgi:hypothetical protein
MKFRDHLCDLRVLIMELIYFVPSIMGHCSVLVEGRRTTKVRILKKGTSSKGNASSRSKTCASDVNIFVSWTQYDDLLKDCTRKVFTLLMC